MGKLLYFDCFSGISGDMTLGAFLDLGIDQNELFRQLDSLKIDGYQLAVRQKQISGITGTDFEVKLTTPAAHQPHRHLSDIEAIIDQGSIDDEVKALSKRIFHTIAQSEAKIHGKSINEIHFHEVGAIDSIVDIVGAAICLNLLQPHKIVSSPLHLGSGTVSCAHGVLPVPAPATADILCGVPVYSTDVKGELVTPTGAAIIKTIADEFSPLPPITIEKIGYGTGKKTFERPNLLRIFWGDESAAKKKEKETLLLETNIDDMNPEVYSYLLPLLLKEGALDAYLTSIIMKKGRPGVMLSVLCEPDQATRLGDIILAETSTLGLRKIELNRSCLERKQYTINTDLGPVRIKSAYKDGVLLRSAPEYEDCKKIAEEKGLALKNVYDIVAGSSDFTKLPNRD